MGVLMFEQGKIWFVETRNGVAAYLKSFMGINCLSCFFLIIYFYFKCFLCQNLYY